MSDSSNFDYRPRSHLERDDVISAFREWPNCVVANEDREWVQRLLHQFESPLNVILVPRHRASPSQPGSSPESAPRRVGASGPNF